MRERSNAKLKEEVRLSSQRKKMSPGGCPSPSILPLVLLIKEEPRGQVRDKETGNTTHRRDYWGLIKTVETSLYVL